MTVEQQIRAAWNGFLPRKITDLKTFLSEKYLNKKMLKLLELKLKI